MRATQFFEFVGRIADGATDGDAVRLRMADTAGMAEATRLMAVY